ncbi:MAG: WXG100 family type VII secretion target [Bacilli bacterium]|nr:WXG100 family type VII secretion target [Bacilli bacterium]
MNGSTLTYEQINAASSNLNQYATEMQAILDEIVSYLSRIGNDDVWSGTAAMASKEKFNTLQAKFGDFYKAVTDEANHLATVVENYKKADTQVSN